MLNVDDRILSEADESQLFLLLHIGKYMDSENFAFPSNDSLCKTTKWSLNKLQRVKASLIESGLLSVVQRLSDKGQTSNGYIIMTDYIGIHVTLKRMSTPLPQNRVPAPPQSDVPPLPQNRVPRYTEVLTNEVLTNEQQNNVGENADGLNNEPSLEAKEKKEPSPTVPARVAIKCEFPENYQHFSDPDGIAKLWTRWVKFRREIKKPIKSEDSALTQLKQLYRFSKGDFALCVKIVEKSIAGGWQSLVEPEASKTTFQQADPEKPVYIPQITDTKQPTWTR